MEDNPTIHEADTIGRATAAVTSPLVFSLTPTTIPTSATHRPTARATVLASAAAPRAGITTRAGDAPTTTTRALNATAASHAFVAARAERLWPTVHDGLATTTRYSIRAGVPSTVAPGSSTHVVHMHGHGPQRGTRLAPRRGTKLRLHPSDKIRTLPPRRPQNARPDERVLLTHKPCPPNWQSWHSVNPFGSLVLVGNGTLPARTYVNRSGR